MPFASNCCRIAIAGAFVALVLIGGTASRATGQEVSGGSVYIQQIAGEGVGVETTATLTERSNQETGKMSTPVGAIRDAPSGSDGDSDGPDGLFDGKSAPCPWQWPRGCAFLNGLPSRLRGGGNVLRVLQVGTGNAVSVKQDGGRNVAGIALGGDDNDVTVHQYNNGNVYKLLYDGSNLRRRVTQDGGHTLIESGSSPIYLIRIKQTGPGMSVRINYNRTGFLAPSTTGPGI